MTVVQMVASAFGVPPDRVLGAGVHGQHQRATEHEAAAVATEDDQLPRGERMQRERSHEGEEQQGVRRQEPEPAPGLPGVIRAGGKRAGNDKRHER